MRLLNLRSLLMMEKNMAGTSNCSGCRYCTQRHVGCHSTCEQYIKWNEQHQKEVKVRRKSIKKYFDGYYHK